MMLEVSWEHVDERLHHITIEMETLLSDRDLVGGVKIYGIPRGGAIVAGLLMARYDSLVSDELSHGVVVVSDATEADLAIDDIIDSGATAERMKQEFGLETVAPADKGDENINEWVHFPWEEDDAKDIESVVIRTLEYLG